YLYSFLFSDSADHRALHPFPTRRSSDLFAAGQLRASLTGQAHFATLDALARRLDNLLAGPETGLDARLQTFFNAVQDVANDPAPTPARQALLGEADSLVRSEERRVGKERCSS